MNNSKIALENLEETKDNRLSFLQNQHGEFTQLVEAINRIESNEDWQRLKKLLLDDVVNRLEKELKSEAEKIVLDPPKIYRLQGQLEWARKYTNLKKIADYKKVEIENIKNLINEQRNPSDGAL